MLGEAVWKEHLRKTGRRVSPEARLNSSLDLPITPAASTHRPSHTRDLALGGPKAPSDAPVGRLATSRSSQGPVEVQPEKDVTHGASRLQYASAARGRLSLRPPEPPLEPEDGALHLRRPQQHPHHRPGADGAAAASGAGQGERRRGRRRPRAVRRHQAPGLRGHRRCRQALGAVLHQSSLARRHADQLEDDLAVDPPPEAARRDARRRGQGPHQEGDPAADARPRLAQQVARRHQGDGRPARPAVRDRHQQGADRHRRGQEARHSRSSPSSTPTAIRTASTSWCRATTMRDAPSRSIAIWSRAPPSTASSAARPRPASMSARARRRRPRSCRQRPTSPPSRASTRRAARPTI